MALPRPARPDRVVRINLARRSGGAASTPIWGLTSPGVANHNGAVMTTEPVRGEDEPPLGALRKDARGAGVRLLAWAVGGLLSVIGIVTTVQELLQHRHGVGPYLLAAGLLVVFLAALDIWRVERTRVRRDTRTIRRFAARIERLEDSRHHLEHDRDQWRMMQAEEASINRRLAERMQRAQRPACFRRFGQRGDIQSSNASNRLPRGIRRPGQLVTSPKVETTPPGATSGRESASPVRPGRRPLVRGADAKSATTLTWWFPSFCGAHLLW